MSHTVKVRVELRDRDSLARAVVALGGEVLGQGTHRLFAGPEEGFGFKLKDWHYPLVLKENGELAYSGS